MNRDEDGDESRARFTSETKIKITSIVLLYVNRFIVHLDD